ncbi:MAG: tetratricopeptide repeat protein, partial [Planctomycetota bacterium]
VIELDPTQTESRFHLALALLDKARYDEALDHLNLVAKAWPDNTLVTCRQARALFMLGREKQARSMLNQQLTQYPKDAKLLSTMGQLDLLSGRNEEAIQFFKDALSLLPSDYQSLYSLSQALNRLGNKEESQKFAKEAERIKAKLERLNDITSNEIALKPLDPAIHEELGRLYEETGQLESAKAWLESSLRLDPQREKAKIELQKVLEKIGQS